MSLSAREQQALDSIEDELAGSDPELASLLATFARHAAGEEMPVREKIPHAARRRGNARRPAPRLFPRLGSQQTMPLRSSPWSPPSCGAAAPGRPRKGANGHDPGRGAGGRPDPAARADRRYQGETNMGAAPDQVVDQSPFEPVVDLVFGRWTPHVLWTLATKGRLRFSELHAQLPAVTPRVLTERLRKLERDGFLRRSYYREIPPRVEYEITPLAETMIPAFRVLAARRRYDAEN